MSVLKLVMGEFKSKSKSVEVSESSVSSVMCRTSESVRVMCESFKVCVE